MKELMEKFMHHAGLHYVNILTEDNSSMNVHINLL